VLNTSHNNRLNSHLKPSSAERNEVFLVGKVSQVGLLRYTPSGVPVGEVVIAVKQSHLELTNMGYFDVVLSGELAEQWFSRLKVGLNLEISGQLWSRNFRNRQGVSQKETKILASVLNESR
jgi:single-stranded DNA-binding protein